MTINTDTGSRAMILSRVLLMLVMMLATIALMAGQALSSHQEQKLFMDCHNESFDKTKIRVYDFFGKNTYFLFGLCLRKSGFYDLVILTDDMEEELDRITILSTSPDAVLSVEPLYGGRFPVKAFFARDRHEIISPNLESRNLISSGKKIKIMADSDDSVYRLLFIKGEIWYKQFIH